MAYKLGIQMRAHLPWWWKLYAATCWAWCRLRGKKIDVDKTAHFVAKHTRYEFSVKSASDENKANVL